MLLADYTAALASVFYLAYGGIKWLLGKRSEALNAFEEVVDILVHLLVLQLIFSIAESIASLLHISASLNDAELVSNAIGRAGSIFWEASQKAISVILYVQTERALLASAPITNPLSSVLGAATGWSTSELSMVAIFFMHLSFASQVFSSIASSLLFIGSILLPVPKLRRLGASLLAIYLATSVALLYSSGVVQDKMKNFVEPSPLNPIDWLRIAGIVSDNAILLGEAATTVALVLTLSTIAGYGLSSVFDSIYVSVVRY